MESWRAEGPERLQRVIMDNPSINNPERSANVVEDEDNTAGHRERISCQDEFRSTVFC